MSRSIISVADREGFVGAFTSVEKAREALAKYRGFPFVHTEWREESEGNEVWALPYTANNAVAFVSANKNSVTEVQKTLQRLDLVPPDDVEFWESELDVVTPAAERRLALVLQVAASAGPEAEADEATVEKFLDFSTQGEEKPMERTNILASVVPKPL